MNIQTNVQHRIPPIFASIVLAIAFAGCASNQPQLSDLGKAKLTSRIPTLGICYQRGLPYTCRTIGDTRGGAARSLNRAGYSVQAGH